MSTEVTWPERALVKDVAWEKVSIFCIFPAVILLFCLSENLLFVEQARCTMSRLAIPTEIDDAENRCCRKSME